MSVGEEEGGETSGLGTLPSGIAPPAPHLQSKNTVSQIKIKRGT